MTNLRSDILKWLMAVITVIASSVNVCASGDDSIMVRPVLSAYTVDYGWTSLLDTYLTPIRYHGYNIRLGYERLQAMKRAPERLVMQMDAGVSYDHVKNEVGNNTMHSLMADYKWGMMRRWNVTGIPLQLYGGGSVQMHGGIIYNSNNSNNPVSVKIHASLNLTGMAAYNVNVLHTPVTLRYQATMPVAEVFFSPEYDESFYEIYVGNHKNLAHFGWWGNRFDMVNLLTADLHFGGTILRVGYRGRIESSWVSNLNTQIYTNSIVIGLCGEWMNARKKMSEQTKVISAMY